jgi:hypothetical protein
VASVKAVPETIDDNPFETPGKTGDDVEGRGRGGDNKDALLHHDLFNGSFYFRSTLDSIYDGNFA